ncbi:MAG: branched-chain amino acid ABC transporter permease [Firmicutes bacterium]|nr:branched-chain amino acid ABC transporter permease [Bacillota bacterium]
MTGATPVSTPRLSGPARILIPLGLAVLIAFPGFASDYSEYLVIHMMMLSLFALGFNLLFGYTGLLSFGQAGFYGIGAYACAFILLHYRWVLLGVVGGVATAAALAAVFGYLLVRHTRIYFTMLTLAFGMLVYSVLWKWRAVTGGDDGLVGIPRAPLGIPGLFALSLESVTRYYYFVLAVTVAAVVILYRIVNSPFGLSLQGIRDSETRSEFVGISVRRHRLLAFVIAGGYAGLAGALLPPLESAVTPVISHWTQSAQPVLVSLLGGFRVFFGPIIGSVLFVLIREAVVRFTEYWQLVTGVVVVGLVIGFRGGIGSVLAALGERGSQAGAGAAQSQGKGGGR